LRFKQATRQLNETHKFKIIKKQVAQLLTISKRTVDNHVSNMFTKTGSKNRVALLNWAMDNGKICRDGFNCCSLPDSDQE